MEPIVTLQDYENVNARLQTLRQQKAALEDTIGYLDRDRSVWLNTPDVWGRLEKFGDNPCDYAVYQKVLQLQQETDNVDQKAIDLLAQLKNIPDNSNNPYNWPSNLKYSLKSHLRSQIKFEPSGEPSNVTLPIVEVQKEPLVEKNDVEVLKDVDDELTKSIQQLIPLLTKLVEKKLTN